MTIIHRTISTPGAATLDTLPAVMEIRWPCLTPALEALLSRNGGRATGARRDFGAVAIRVAPNQAGDGATVVVWAETPDPRGGGSLRTEIRPEREYAARLIERDGLFHLDVFEDTPGALPLVQLSLDGDLTLLLARTTILAALGMMGGAYERPRLSVPRGA